MKNTSKKELDFKLTKESIEKLLENNFSIKSICKSLDINYTHYNNYIQLKLKEYNLKIDKTKQNNNWKKWEKEYLKENYPYEEKEKILSVLKSRSWEAIKIQANKQSIIRCNLPYKNSDIRILLEDNFLSYYWIGFLMADGHFSENRVTLSINKKDINHLKKLSSYLSINHINQNKHGVVTISFMDSFLIPQLKQKFNIKNRKTYEPCYISNIKNDNLFFSLMIGFIDGDGHITYQYKRKDHIIIIKCHSSWIDNFNIFSNKLENILNIKMAKAYINKYGYVVLNIANNKAIKYLKNKSQELNLPVLNRKWDVINLDK